MARYAFLVDVTRCSGCHSCFLACKDEHIGNDRGVTGPLCEGKTFIRINEVEYGTADKIKVDFHPIMCQQCQDPACMKLNPGALYKDANGIIQIDEAKAAGNEKLVKDCPYGAIVWNAERNVPQKCTMCAHRIAEGKAPRCADACPAQALVWGDLDDPNSEISLALKERNLVLEDYKAELNTQPTTKYSMLPKPFICGEVIANDECLEGVKVVLTCKDCGKVMETKTNFCGDFEFKQLPRNTSYVVKIEAPGYAAVEQEVYTNVAKNLGTIELK